MSHNRYFGLNTGTLPSGEFYHVVQHPVQANLGLVVTSGGDSFDTSMASLAERGLVPDPIHVRERKNCFETLLPPTIGSWHADSLKRFQAGELPPDILRGLFEETRRFIAAFAWIPHVVSLNFAAILPFVSFFIALFPAVPIAEIRGPISSGKSTLMRVLAEICRSAIFCSNSTPAAISRVRAQDPCTLLFDEPLPHSKDAENFILASYKQDTGRLICGSGNEVRPQAAYGLSVKVLDRASEALKSRVITIETVPCPHRLPPYISMRHRDEAERLVGRFFWLSLLHYETVLDEYTRFMETTALLGRDAEKIGPLVAIARSIDASDPDREPISPGLEEYLGDQLARQREERLTTDPELLVLSGTNTFVSRNGKPADSPFKEVSAAELTEFLRGDSGEPLSIQQVGGYLRKHGIIARMCRSRRLNSPTNGQTQHPRTLYELDLSRLGETLAIHGITNTEEQEV